MVFYIFIYKIKIIHLTPDMLNTREFSFAEAKIVAYSILTYKSVNVQKIYRMLPLRSEEEILIFINICQSHPQLLSQQVQFLFHIVNRILGSGIEMRERLNVVKTLKYFSEKQTDVAYKVVEDLFFASD